jgi:hypothetical protein
VSIGIEGEDCIDRGKGEMWCPPPIIGVSDTTPREKKSLGRQQRVKKVYNLKLILERFICDWKSYRVKPGEISCCICVVVASLFCRKISRALVKKSAKFVSYCKCPVYLM